jgi:UDP-2,3-diacylglucosamine pyrophosphatase LpxH
LELVQKSDIPFKLDSMDGLEMIIRLTDRVSFKTIDSLVVWVRKRFGSQEITFARHAMKEEAFLDRKAQFVVYGHTHHHEVVPLDSFSDSLPPTNQIYINSGTWHTYYDLAISKPEEQKFVPYQVLTYVSFYKETECLGRRFETWSGSFSD